MVAGRPVHGVVLLAAAAVLGGCASEPARRFDLAPGEDASRWPTWPTAPEVPRFAYVGHLTGETNYAAVDRSGESQARDVFAWLVGLADDPPDPTVLQRPQGGTVDGAGRVLVTDVSRGGVFVFDEQASNVEVWDRAASDRLFVAPIGVTTCGGEGIFVTDAELGLVARLDGAGNPQAVFGEGLLKRPTGIACDGGRGELYVADTRANDVKVLDLAGNLSRTIGHGGDGRGELNAPTYLALANGLLYVTDTLNARVQVFDAEGQIVRTVGERGLYIGDLTRPKGLAVDGHGHVYVIESFYDHLLVFDQEGRFLMPIGGTGKGPGQFYLPAGVWTDDTDRVYVADMFNGRVSVFQYLGGEE